MGCGEGKGKCRERLGEGGDVGNSVWFAVYAVHSTYG